MGILLGFGVICLVVGVSLMTIGAILMFKNVEDGSREMFYGGLVTAIFSVLIIAAHFSREYGSLKADDYYIENSVTYRNDMPVDTMYNIYYRKIYTNVKRFKSETPLYKCKKVSDYYIEVTTTYHDTIPYIKTYTIFYKK